MSTLLKYLSTLTAFLKMSTKAVPVLPTKEGNFKWAPVRATSNLLGHWDLNLSLNETKRPEACMLNGKHCSPKQKSILTEPEVRKFAQNHAKTRPVGLKSDLCKLLVRSAI